MHLETIPTGAIQANCYILWNDHREALVIDPGADPEKLNAFIQENGLTVIAYPVTHGHYDHISFLTALHRLHPAPIGLHAEDERWAFTHDFNQYAPFYPLPERPETIERHWEDGQVWKDGGMEYEIIFTPGHSPGGVCFWFQKDHVLIAGDTLFRGSMGRVDLPGADPAAMNRSLLRLMELPDETAVYPGHGPATTIGHERRTNPFILQLMK